MTGRREPWWRGDAAQGVGAVIQRTVAGDMAGAWMSWSGRNEVLWLGVGGQGSGGDGGEGNESDGIDREGQTGIGRQK